MEKKFPSFYNLVDEDPVARKYFNSLPTAIKGSVESNAQTINSLASLKKQAKYFSDTQS